MHSGNTGLENRSLVPEATVPSDSAADGRRNFLVEALAVAVGAFVGMVPFAAGLLAFFDPLRRRGGGGEFLPVVSLAKLPDDGIPRPFPVVADRDDAWNHYRAQPLGSVFLRRQGKVVDSVNADCPHLGCMVDFVDDEKIFRCPCHNSLFKPDGERIIPPGGNCPAPRSLDPLKVEIRGEGDAAMVWVKFEKFRAGTPERVVEA